MMICKADLEDFFPDLFPSEPTGAASPSETARSGNPIYRRGENLALPAPGTRPRQAAYGRTSGQGSDRPGNARPGALAGAMPAAAAYAAVWTMLSGSRASGNDRKWSGETWSM